MMSKCVSSHRQTVSFDEPHNSGVNGKVCQMTGSEELVEALERLKTKKRNCSQNPIKVSRR